MRLEYLKKYGLKKDTRLYDAYAIYMSEKKLIVPLAREPKAKKSKPARNHLLLSLKKNDLELDFQCH